MSTNKPEPPQQLVDFVKELNEQWINDDVYKIELQFRYGEIDDGFVGLLKNITSDEYIPNFFIPLDVNVPGYFYRTMVKCIQKGHELGMVNGVNILLDQQQKKHQTEALELLRGAVPNDVFILLRSQMKGKQHE